MASKDKEVLELLQGITKSIEELKIYIKDLRTYQEKLKANQEELKIEVKSIDKKIDILYNAVAGTKEDITEIKNKVYNLENVIKTNCYEIANLKLVK
ncbi:MAG: hypothetical protein MSA89_06390 [Clostridium sp.]|nr:hypothetical protein [Clostridium sp.]MCI7442699.1 hypothetical protein [Clostridium sp.]